ncbi:MAG: flavodoxin domain-containing protein [Eubacteriales bacterium]
MNTIIIYATKHGTVHQCASQLSKAISGKVDLYRINKDNFPDLSQYDAVIIGGSIYAGRIQKEIKEFCNENISELMRKKIGLFICCMLQENAQTNLKQSFPEDLFNAAIAKDCFGGEMKFSDMNFLEKTITKMVSKSNVKKDSQEVNMDMTKDISMISEENIQRFANIFNG